MKTLSLNNDAETRSRTPIFIRKYLFAQRCLRIEVFDERFAEQINEHFAGTHFATPADADSKPDVTLRVHGQSISSAHVAPDMPRFEVAHGFCFTDGNRFLLKIHHSHIAASPDNRVDVWIDDRDGGAGSRDLLVPVFNYATELLLRRCGLFTLHAAGVIEPVSSAGVAIIGASGSGKSTLATQLARSGWGYLSDDQLCLVEIDNEEDGSAVDAHALRRYFNVDEKMFDSREWKNVRESLGGRIANARHKRWLNPTTAFPDNFRPLCRPRLLVFPICTGAASTHLRILTQAEAMIKLLRLNPWSSYDLQTARTHQRVLRRLVGQTKSIVLEAGVDLLAQPSRAADLIGAHLAP